MPWTKSDVEKFNQGLTDKQKDVWVSTANNTLKACMDKGQSEKVCSAQAIKTANAMAMRTKEAAVPTDLSFATELMEAKALDEEKGIYQVALIREGLTTDKKREYPRATLEAARPLFEGLQAYADHPTKTEMRDRPERSIRDLVGYYKNPVLSEGKLVAELHTLDNASWIRPVLKAACDNPGLCGLSIHGDGSVKSRGKGNAEIVESIDNMFSTDVVTKPNAGGEIQRLIASDRGGETSMEWSDITLETLKENRPELVEELDTATRKDERTKAEAEFKEAADIQKAKETEDRGDMVKKADYDKLAETVENMTIASKISESHILDTIEDKKDKETAEAELTDSLRGKTDEDMDKVIEARKVFLKSAGVEVKGAPAKESQTTEKKHVIGSILAEARNV